MNLVRYALSRLNSETETPALAFTNNSWFSRLVYTELQTSQGSV
jgi:hypothetical protein